ncbi:hypothetical protein COL516b_010126 [Colletotrichum fioriniae]|nr:uncharacterized protein COL516b_010126 [Colletotrichum fioriniae]KAJ0298203.1 hypothetical protein COL516b_010126 [Colletotrichum fioriniae]
MKFATSLCRYVRPTFGSPLIQPLQPVRWARFQAFEADFDPEELEKARSWHKSFNGSQLPKGQTTYARSSGPGGQHVNKSDSLTFQAQTHRQRDANSEENQQKLIDEIKRIYQETVPGETSSDKKKKHAEM